MPYKSEAQKKWLYANKPNLAAQFESETPKDAKLPTRISSKSSSEKRQYARQQRIKQKSNERFGKLAKNFAPARYYAINHVYLSVYVRTIYYFFGGGCRAALRHLGCPIWKAQALDRSPP